jgi:hypothetical protein
MAITSKEINLPQLDKELGSKGLIANFEDKKNKIIKPADQSNVSEEQLEAAIAAHVALPEAEPTLDQKLASVGLSIADLKTGLGL